MKQVSQLNEDGYFIGITIADASPLEPDVFLIPGGAIDVDPPVVPEGQRARWDGEWVFENIPQPEIILPTPEEKAEIMRMQLQNTYESESDPLFFKAQRGEATIQDWLLKVAEIKARFIKD